MRHWLAAAALLLAPVSGAGAEDAAGAPALREAMSGLFVVVPTDPVSGAAMMEVVRSADGASRREVVVAFLDAGDAAATATAAGLGDRAEGRLLNAGELFAIAGGDVVWRTSADNAVLVNGDATHPPAFYVVNTAGDPLTQPIEGRDRIVFYVDALAADAARVAAENKLSAAGQPAPLSVIAADLASLIDGVRSGDAKDVYFASSPTVIIWAAQWEQGARLIRDFKGK
ncbi:MAG: hypothetical protein FP825_14120 [Hyphomonas sp.]|uniref:hypothetical protein n=1 Tax=Hyphomonas sp. TaxID=87 RepID=UPI00184B6353|nr:hypothetical protein [Hyphomonas sp.]MBA3069605.1 hypothetical protein [Hyphomonas sp.]MBU4063234.1 hypothetical protein [Alphaproteobacteria bacterium]MBU4164052.1 hypothetical protein [Alphaproteobacteria bacterium]MBU4569383.1 hypothetical protein [Alphaproteobacteria bacterium]